MAELDNAEVALLGTSAMQEALIKGWIRAFVWRLYDEHKDDEVLTIKILFFRKTIRVRDFGGILERWFGRTDA